MEIQQYDFARLTDYDWSLVGPRWDGITGWAL